MAGHQTGTVRITCTGASVVDIAELSGFQGTLKTLTPTNAAKLRAQIVDTGFSEPISIWQHDGKNLVLNGHQRLTVLNLMRMEGWHVPAVPVSLVEAADEDEARRKVLAFASQYGSVTTEGLAAFLDTTELALPELEGFVFPEVGPADYLAATGAGPDVVPPARALLAERFGAPPFSILDARRGYWQERKRQWLGLGIQSEAGRADDALSGGGMPSAAAALAVAQGRPVNRKLAHGSSVFDPVLCELCYRWFCPPGGTVLDPFAGGSVRGIVAATLGRPYVGIDLSGEQLEENEEQWAHIGPGLQAAADARGGGAVPAPVWLCGDGVDVAELWPGGEAGMVFTCPPYADLERYSDDPRDLSTMEYGAFVEALGSIVEAAAGCLKPGRFAVVVVGEARGKDGTYYGVVPDTVRAFMRAGLHFYNEAALVTPCGTMGMRATKQFTSGRKLVKGHQNVLVFWKGDPASIHRTVQGWPCDGVAIEEHGGGTP